MRLRARLDLPVQRRRQTLQIEQRRIGTLQRFEARAEPLERGDDFVDAQRLIRRMIDQPVNGERDRIVRVRR